MTKRALEKNIFAGSDKNDIEQIKIERISKSHWMTDYYMDIFNTMKESELRRRPMYFISTQDDQRPQLLHLCQLLVRTYKLSRGTLHLSIYYLDRFIDFYTIRPDKLQLVVLICVHIAAQIENMDACVPRYSEMNRMTKNCYKPFEFKAVERKVLTFFQFELIRPTTASFVEMFSCSFLTREDYLSYTKALQECPTDIEILPVYTCFEQMLSALAQFLLRMADYTLNIHRLSNVPPSLLAAICIAAVRQVRGLPKRWTPYLTELTSYSEHMLDPYVDLLTQYHDTYTQTRVSEQKQQQQTETSWPSPDSGFEEIISTPKLEVVGVATDVKNNACNIEMPKTGKRNCSNQTEEHVQTKRSRLDAEQHPSQT